MMNNHLKSIGAVFAGFIVVVALSLATDLLLQRLNFVVQPFIKNPAWVIILVILYRCLFGVTGSYITARLAPSKPMQLAMTGGAIGFVISLAGLILMWDTPPRWYGITLVITALPCAWLGAKLYLKKTTMPGETKAV